MIKIFRRVRHKLLSENKLSKYLIYALGEIVLVVIGILIALQINNLNEQRKQKNLEQNYLRSLKKEFENNLIEVDRVIELTAKLHDNAQEMAKYTGPKLLNITEKKFGELYFGTINSEVQYRPGSGVLNEIINSGKLNIFQNKGLKNALATLDAMLLQIRFQENEELSEVRRSLIIIGRENASQRRMAYDAFGGLFGVDEGRFVDSNKHLLTSMKFDNLITGFIFTSGYLKSRYEAMKKQLKTVVDIINAQIK